MNCPVCNSVLIEHSNFKRCPKKHGVLLSAKHLMRKESVTIEDSEVIVNTDSTIPCPSCNKIMTKVDYNHTGVIIDSCMNCHARWLDGGEFTKLKQHKPTLSPEQLLFIDEFDRMNEQGNEEEMDNQIPGYATGKVGAVGRVLSAGNERRTLGWIGGGAVYGSIRVLVKGNRYQKIIFFISVVLFVLFMVYLWKTVQNGLSLD